MNRHTDTPKIHHARTLCESLKARGVIVLAFTEDNVAAASYGETKAECAQLKGTLDAIIRDIEEGEIPVWAQAGLATWKRRDNDAHRKESQGGA